VHGRRAAEVLDLQVMAHWAALHGGGQRRGPDGERVESFGNRLVDVGGEGTPLVQEFCLGELAIARETGAVATQRALADVLDLQHRLPRVWRRVVDLQCDVWVARKVATLSRPLALERVALVDAAVAEAIGKESPSRVVALAEAKVIEADPDAHAAKVADAAHRRYVSLSRADAAGLKTVIARVTAGDGAWIDATVDRAADLLAPQYPELSRDELRSMAFGLLAPPRRAPRPAGVRDVRHVECKALRDASSLCCSGITRRDPGRPERVRERTVPGLGVPRRPPRRPAGHRAGQAAPRGALYLHLHEAVAAGLVPGVARVEDGGPLLPAQLADLLGGAHVTLKPIVDLSDDVQTCAYEHPEGIKERVWLTSRGDIFPFSTGSETRDVDNDHPVPYDPLGPPGQTGTHNSGPLGRRHHRWKTHAGYQARQIGPAAYLWRTPHGRYYLVDSLGTCEVDADAGRAVMDGPTESEPGVWGLTGSHPSM